MEWYLLPLKQDSHGMGELFPIIGKTGKFFIGKRTAGCVGGKERMSVKVFIDGSSGTTGLRIADRLAQRPEIELLSISAEGRKDVNERAKVINSADLAFLCLPDEIGRASCRERVFRAV